MSLLYDWTNDVMVVSDVRTLETNVTSVAKGLFAKADGWGKRSIQYDSCDAKIKLDTLVWTKERTQEDPVGLPSSTR